MAYHLGMLCFVVYIIASAMERREIRRTDHRMFMKKKLTIMLLSMVVAVTMLAPLQAFAQDTASVTGQQSEQTSSQQVTSAPAQTEQSVKQYVVKFKATDSHGHALKGAEFRVSEQNGGVQAASASLKLASGIYTVTETKAPAGYKAAAPQKFSISDNGSVLVKGKTQQDRTVTLISQKIVKTSGHSGHIATHHGRTGHTAHPAKSSTARAKTGTQSGHHANVKRGAESTEGATEEGESDETSGNADDASHTILTGAAGVTNDGVQPINTNTLAEQTGSAVGGNDASEFFHATITSENRTDNTYTSGETAVYAVEYQIDYEKIKDGDFVTVNIPTNIARHANIAVSTQHFRSVENLGNGQYKLIFNENAPTAISGTFKMIISTSNDENSQVTETIQVGQDTATIVVNPYIKSTGSGKLDYGIRKDSIYGDVISWSGYDYSDKNVFHQIGSYDSTKLQTVTFRLMVNERQATISNIVIDDVLPEGMSFSAGQTIQVQAGDLSGENQFVGELVDKRDYSCEITGNALKIRITGSQYTKTNKCFYITYSVDIPANDGTPLVNKSAVSYKNLDGTSAYEQSYYTTQGVSSSASNAVKKVDKTALSADSTDQTVTYTIHFWNKDGFEKNKIEFNDTLAKDVELLSVDGIKQADGSYKCGYFSLTPSKIENGQWNLSVSNIDVIPGSTSADIIFKTDFTKVAPGTTVENTINSSTVKTNTVVTKKTESITVDKEWSDNNDQAGKRPNSVSIQLYKNGNKQGDPVQLTQDNNWKYTWKDIQDNKDDVYTVQEVGDLPAGYTSNASGNNYVKVKDGKATIINNYEQNPKSRGCCVGAEMRCQ